MSLELAVLTGVVGLIFGSFITMLSYRLPRVMGEEFGVQLKAISIERSSCPSCGTTLPWYRLFPVLSWALSKGKCHSCGVKIAFRYPVTELAAMLCTLAPVMVYGLTPIGVMGAIFLLWLLLITVIDFEHRLILDNLSLPLMWLGLIFNASLPGLVSLEEAVYGAVAGYMAFWFIYKAFKLITGKEGMGYGDFKLIAAIGAWVGFASLPAVILIASVFAILVAIVLTFFSRYDKNLGLPFGPMLSFGGAVVYLHPSII